MGSTHCHHQGEEEEAGDKIRVRCLAKKVTHTGCLIIRQRIYGNTLWYSGACKRSGNLQSAVVDNKRQSRHNKPPSFRHAVSAEEGVHQVSCNWICYEILRLHWSGAENENPRVTLWMMSYKQWRIYLDGTGLWPWDIDSLFTGNSTQFDDSVNIPSRSKRRLKDFSLFVGGCEINTRIN